MLKIQKELQKIDPGSADPALFGSILENNGVIEKGLIKQLQHPDYPELFLFNYNKIVDFSNPLVQECRGLILDSTNNTWNPVCHSYEKFFNHNQPEAATINWGNFKVFEKLDGSCLNLWHYKGVWNVSTNGSPDAGGNVNESDLKFKDLFWQVFGELQYKLPDYFSESFRDLTFMFELMTPYNQIVVRHDVNNLILTGIRRRSTGQEVDVNAFRNCYKIVPNYNFSDLDDLKLHLDRSPFEHEGYVVVDSCWNRVKIKSDAYVRMHHMRSNFSDKNCLKIILESEDSEFCGYFPEFRSKFDNFKAKIIKSNDIFKNRYDEIKDLTTQKEFAILALKTPMFSSPLFMMRKGEIDDIVGFLNKITLDKALEFIQHF